MELLEIDTTSAQTCFEHAASQGHPDARRADVRYGQTVLVGHQLYVTGAICLSEHMEKRFATIGVLDIRQSKWRWIRCEGPGYIDGAACLREDAMFLLVPERDKNLLSIYVFDLALEIWSQLYCWGPNPGARRCFSGHFIEDQDEVLVFGGNEGRLMGEKLNDVWIYSIEKQLWTKPRVDGEPPMPRWQHGSCIHAGVFYCYGGWSPGSRASDGLFLLHLKSRNQRKLRWSKPQTNAQDLGPLSSFAMVSVNGTLLLCGGKAEGGHGNHMISRVDPASFEFEFSVVNLAKGAALWPGFGLTATCIENGKAILLFGGANYLGCYHKLLLPQ